MLLYIKTLFVMEVLLLLGLAIFHHAIKKEYSSVVRVKVWVLQLLLPAFALIPGSIYVFYAFLVGALLSSTKSRADVATVYLSLIPMTPSLDLDTSIAGVPIITLSAPIILGVGGIVGILLTKPNQKEVDPTFDLCAFALVSLFIFIESRGTSFTNVLRVAVATSVVYIPPYVIASRGFKDAKDLRLGLLSLGLAAFLSSVISVFSTARGWDLYATFNERLDVELPLGSSYLAMRAGFIRIGGPFVDYTGYGIFLAFVLAFLPVVRSSFKASRVPVIWVVVISGLLVTQSRGAWIAAIAGLMTYSLLQGKIIRAAIITGVLAFGYSLLRIVAASSNKLSESIGVSGSSVETVGYRRRLLQRGFEQISSHPIIGQSPKKIIANMPDMVQGQHIVDMVNTHLFIAMSSGLVGFFIWFMIWWIPLQKLQSARIREKWSEHRYILATPTCMIVVVGVGILFTSWIDRILYWPLIAIGFARVIYAKQKSKSEVATKTMIRPEFAASSGL